MPGPLRSAAVLGCLTLTLACGGCGNGRTRAPDLSTAAPPQGFHKLTVSVAGVSLLAPRNWTATNQSSPLVVTLNSGPAVIALWRLARSAPPPDGDAALAADARRLMHAVRARDRTISGLHWTATRVDGVRAVRLDALEQVAGHTRQVTSTHVYIGGAELVLDEYAPPAQFAAVTHSVFEPVLRSLMLLGTG